MDSTIAGLYLFLLFSRIIYLVWNFQNYIIA